MKATLEAHFGTDLDVVNAARVSFSNKSDWDYKDCGHADCGPECPGEFPILKARDANLIQYLARGLRKSEWELVLQEFADNGSVHHFGQGELKERALFNIESSVINLMNMAQHWVPFTHNYIRFHMVAPVPIARQCFKHKVGFTESEESRRYIKTTPTLYIPEEFRASAEDVKQGSGGKHTHSDAWQHSYVNVATNAISMYEAMIKDGVAPEQARFVLPQGCEVQWIWSGNLASFARYVIQRSDPHAQLESQMLAKQVSDQIAPLFPVSWAALVNSGRTFTTED